MLPPILEIFIVWHPQDECGAKIADEFIEHFRGSPFTGLIGGAVEVFVRSKGWKSAQDAPRPLPCERFPLPNGLQQSKFTAVVPVLGTELAAVVEKEKKLDKRPWTDYFEGIRSLREQNQDTVGIFPYLLNNNAEKTLDKVLGPIQRIAAKESESNIESKSKLRCRELSQGIADLLWPERTQQPLKVFISYTKRSAPSSEDNATELLNKVHDVISDTRLSSFFAPTDLKPGQDWERTLLANAANSALLALRTDLYPSREWCQKEVLIAKQEGMPIVILNALDQGEERGSFLMDHVRRVSIGKLRDSWSEHDIYRALSLLVDECLKNALWRHQSKLLIGEATQPEIHWSTPNAPEPITFLHWLKKTNEANNLPKDKSDIRIVHPEPPLGPDEKLIFDQLLKLSKGEWQLDIITPRMLAARRV